ncbi:hypothetical protein HOC87_05915, partial [Candidatus Bathyarchaeota archaeon]|nr:hypothetical protein [Candidatus Bathyarchaeota archaeon]
PTVLVTGDQAAIDEAKALCGVIETATVKWALGEKEKLGALSIQRALSLSPGKAQDTIRVAAKRAMNKIDTTMLFKIKTPFNLKVEYTEAKYVDRFKDSPEVEMLSETSFTKRCNSLDEIIF